MLSRLRKEPQKKYKMISTLIIKGGYFYFLSKLGLKA